MRSSNKSRSRNKNNRNRSVGNVVNRVFDSSGPEGRVRGTPQQIVEKYQALAHDAQLSNDPVSAENFKQHAEHYLRLLSEGQREMAEKQAADAAARQQRNEQQSREKNNGAHQRGGSDQQPSVENAEQPHISEDAPQPVPADAGAGSEAANVVATDDSDTGLVETPENKAPESKESKPKPRTRTRSAAPKTKEVAVPPEPQAPAAD